MRMFFGAALCGLLIAPLAVGRGTAVKRTRGAAGQEASPDWQRYVVHDEEFSVLLPALPAMSTSTFHDEAINKDFQERIIAAYADGVVYAIYTFEKRRDLQSVTDFIQKFARPASTEEARDLTVNGYSGKEFIGQTVNGKYVSQYFAARNHVYELTAASSSLVNPESGFARFFSSLTFEKNPQGRALVNGFGEPAKRAVIGSSEMGTLKAKEVTRKASVITKPEPHYTERARKHQVTGTVVLRGVFRSSGELTEVQVVKGLPDGLTETAIVAARQIRYIPAIKDGHFVSMYMLFEYNFNLY